MFEKLKNEVLNKESDDANFVLSKVQPVLNSIRKYNKYSPILSYE